MEKKSVIIACATAASLCVAGLGSYYFFFRAEDETPSVLKEYEQFIAKHELKDLYYKEGKTFIKSFNEFAKLIDTKFSKDKDNKLLSEYKAMKSKRDVEMGYKVTYLKNLPDNNLEAALYSNLVGTLNAFTNPKFSEKYHAKELSRFKKVALEFFNKNSITLNLDAVAEVFKSRSIASHIKYLKISEVPQGTSLDKLNTYLAIQPEEVDLSSLNKDKLKNVNFDDKLKVSSIKMNKIEQIDLSTIKLPKNLKRLEVRDCQITTFDPKCVQNPVLEYLDISSNNLSALPDFSKFSNLKELVISESEDKKTITKETIAKHLKNLKLKVKVSLMTGSKKEEFTTEN